MYISITYIHPQRKRAKIATSKNEIWNSFESILQNPLIKANYASFLWNAHVIKIFEKNLVCLGSACIVYATS